MIGEKGVTFTPALPATVTMARIRTIHAKTDLDPHEIHRRLALMGINVDDVDGVYLANNQPAKPDDEQMKQLRRLASINQ